MKTWSKPYYGVSHYGEYGDQYRSTISDWGSFVELSKWFPGCQFSPIKETYDSIDEAKAAGEAWANETWAAPNGKRSARRP